jgi:hypothetical protein
MDEIDGMSGGDRGGVGALKKIVSTTKVPFGSGSQSNERYLLFAFAMTVVIQN